MTEIKDVLNKVVSACQDKKAAQCVVLDMATLTTLTDYYLICHGTSERQVQAIARGVKEAVEEDGKLEVRRMEGFQEGRWILIDLGDIVCHIFHQEERAHYNLEKLWGDAQKIEIEGE